MVLESYQRSSTIAGLLLRRRLYQKLSSPWEFPEWSHGTCVLAVYNYPTFHGWWNDLLYCHDQVFVDGHSSLLLEHPCSGERLVFLVKPVPDNSLECVWDRQQQYMESGSRSICFNNLTHRWAALYLGLQIKIYFGKSQFNLHLLDSIFCQILCFVQFENVQIELWKSK